MFDYRFHEETLVYSERYSDFVFDDGETNETLALCSHVVDKRFLFLYKTPEVGDKITVRICNKPKEQDGWLHLIPGRIDDEEHWFLETAPYSCTYTHHYVFSAAREILESLLETWETKSLWVKVTSDE